MPKRRKGKLTPIKPIYFFVVVVLAILVSVIKRSLDSLSEEFYRMMAVSFSVIILTMILTIFIFIMIRVFGRTEKPKRRQQRRDIYLTDKRSIQPSMKVVEQPKQLTMKPEYTEGSFRVLDSKQNYQIQIIGSEDKEW